MSRQIVALVQQGVAVAFTTVGPLVEAGLIWERL
jgi:hypothetical protein